MSHPLIASALAAALFAGMLAFAVLGRRIGIVRLARGEDDPSKGSGAAEAAVFGLLGLLVAFTFSGAATRFESRRHLVTEEVNAIGTAYLRLDLLPAGAQPELRELFRRYLDNRWATYGNARDRDATKAKLAEGTALQQDIWTKALAASLGPGAPTQAAMLVLPALNEMIDITTTREMATRNHPPPVVFLLLCGVSMLGALLVGFGGAASKQRNWFHIAIFAAILSLTVYVISDLEFPRLGIIRIDAADQIFGELRQSMR